MLLTGGLEERFLVFLLAGDFERGLGFFFVTSLGLGDLERDPDGLAERPLEVLAVGVFRLTASTVPPKKFLFFPADGPGLPPRFVGEGLLSLVFVTELLYSPDDDTTRYDGLLPHRFFTPVKVLLLIMGTNVTCGVLVTTPVLDKVVLFVSGMATYNMTR